VIVIPTVSLEHSGLRKTDARTISDLCRQLISQAVGQNLNLTPLDEIVICRDFQNTVFSFQRRVGIPEEMTNEAGCIACAKTIWYRQSGKDMRVKIFIDAYYFLSLGQSEAPGILPLGVYLLAHELGHVHDDTCMIEQFGDNQTPSLGDPDSILRFVSRCTWGEYFAESIASRTQIGASRDFVRMGFELTFENLKLMQRGTLSSVKAGYRQYHIDRNASELWSTIVTNSSNHLQAIGRIAPYVESLPHADIRESMGNCLGVFRSLTYDLIGELRNLRSLYGHWQAFSWSRLEKSVEDMWELCGVKPQSLNSGCNIQVLVRPN